MKSRGITLTVLLLAILMITACGQSEATTSGEEPSAIDEATAVAVAQVAETSTPTEEPTEEPEPTATNEPTIEPTPEPTLEPTQEPTPETASETCLTCHGDKEQLIETAAPEPEEPESSESSGVG